MNEIKEWILNSYSLNKKLSFQSCLFISGYSGIGKTYMLNEISNDLNLFIVNIDSFNCSSSLQLSDLLFKSFTSSLLQTLMNNTNKKIIIIDDYDVLLALDNNISLTLFNFINTNTNKLKHIPIICIINTEVVKRIGDIKKKCKILEFPKITDDDFFKILKKYKSDLLIEDATLIIKKTNSNISEAIKILTNTYFNNNDEIMTIKDLYSNSYNRTKIVLLILKEQWIIPLNFHENLITELMENRKALKKIKENFYKKFILNFCYFDIFMNSNNDIGIHFFVSIIEELFHINIKTTSKINNNFTKMLSYLSLQKKNNKTFYNNKTNKFPLYHIGNYHLSLINRKFIY